MSMNFYMEHSLVSIRKTLTKYNNDIPNEKKMFKTEVSMT